MRSLREQITDVIFGEVAASGRFQTDIARAIWITAKHLNRIVNGRDHPSPELVDKILAELDREPVLATLVKPAHTTDACEDPAPWPPMHVRI